MMRTVLYILVVAALGFGAVAVAQEGSSQPSTPPDQSEGSSAPAQPFESPPPQPEQPPEEGSDDAESADDASPEQSSESETTPDVAEAQTITDIVILNDDFETLEQALVAADLTTILAGEGPFTVFAPNDAAFARLTEDELDALLSDTDALRRLLLYHVAEGVLIPESELTMMDTVSTASDGASDGDADGNTGPSVRQAADGVYLNDARIVQAGIEASNGLVHVIDVVLRPPQPSE